MSLVGPRPERPEFVHRLMSDLPQYYRRLAVSPGITGWAQINVKADQSKSDVLKKLDHDIYYIHNKNLLFDMYILLRTIDVALFGHKN
jgi:lipopolysaccharide/colanic/teichoic acid biosynthesis glycosyltransferase